ncbi:MAG: hypothetical protein AAGA10_10360 [Bacteroidota bacterium]
MKLRFFSKVFSSLGMLAYLLVGCQTESGREKVWDLHIQDQGLSFISIGDRYTRLDSLDIPYKLTETAYTQEQGYIWLVREMFLDSGKVTFEGNYFKEESLNETDIQNSHLNRIRIESPQLSLPNGIKTGMTFKKLKEKLNDAELELILLNDYNIIDISAPEVSNAHFLFPCPDTLSVDSSSIVVQLPPTSLPENSLMEAIVIL